MSSRDHANQNDLPAQADRESTNHPNQSQAQIPAASEKSQPRPSETYREITCKTEKSWWDKAKQCLEAAGIVFLGIYTAYTIKMYSANRDAADAARRATEISGATLSEMEREHRPWMAPTGFVTLSAPPKFAFIPAGEGHRKGMVKVGADGVFQMRNFGESPAFGVTANFEVAVPYPPTETTTRPRIDALLCHLDDANGGEVLFPGTIYNLSFHNETIHAASPPTTEVYRIWLLGCVGYRDNANRPHFTKFWLRSTHPPQARWIIVPNGRHMPISGFESWGQEAD